MKKIGLASLLFLGAVFNVTGQTFISAVSQFQAGNGCVLELLDGTIINGKVGSATIAFGYLSSLTVKDEAGVKHKHKAETIKEFKMKMGFMAKMDAAAEGSSSIGEMFDTDYSEIIEREYIIYRQALLPKKKDKYRLLQLVNPGFDSKIQVFDDPGGKESKGLIGGGKEKSYLVVLHGKKSVEVKKGNYKKDFPDIYGDCKSFMGTIDGKKPKFWDMAGHVFAYDQLCGDE